MLEFIGEYGLDEPAYVCDTLDEMIASMRPDDFVINHDYKVKEMYDDPAGKWAAFMRDSVLMEQ